MQVGILHPGEMGVTVAVTVRRGGHTVHWAGERRSAATRARAEAAGLEDAGFLTALCQACGVIFSVCPPHAAEEQAQSVASRRFKGIYVDANAIAPERARRLAALIEGAGGRFVDGGIVGPPAVRPGTTRLYLTGAAAGEVAELLQAGPLEPALLDGPVGRASALKMCYAAYSKGTLAMLAAIVAAAEAHGVREDLLAQWAATDGAVAARARDELGRAAAKAWRWSGEMEEIAATLRAAGQPGEFHDAAGAVFARLAGFKASGETPTGDVVIAALRELPSENSPRPPA